MNATCSARGRGSSFASRPGSRRGRPRTSSESLDRVVGHAGSFARSRDSNARHRRRRAQRSATRPYVLSTTPGRFQSFQHVMSAAELLIGSIASSCPSRISGSWLALRPVPASRLRGRGRVDARRFGGRPPAVRSLMDRGCPLISRSRIARSTRAPPGENEPSCQRIFLSLKASTSGHSEGPTDYADLARSSPPRRAVRETIASRPPRRSPRGTTTSSAATLPRDLLVVEVDGRTVGYGRIWWDEEPDGPRVYRQVCFLDPAFGGRGIGRRMLIWNEDRFREIAAQHDRRKRAWRPGRRPERLRRS